MHKPPPDTKESATDSEVDSKRKKKKALTKPVSEVRSNWEHFKTVQKNRKKEDLFAATILALTVLSVASSYTDPRPHVDIVCNGLKIKALADTGATASIISEKCFKKINGSEDFPLADYPPGSRLTGASGAALTMVKRVQMPLELLGVKVDRPIYVVAGLNTHSFIMGIDMIRELHLCVSADTVVLQTVLPGIDPGAHAVFPLQDFVVPARTVMRKEVFFLDQENAPKKGQTMVTTPNFAIPHVWQGISTVQEDGGLWTVVANMTDEDLLVPGNCALAVAEEVDPNDCKEATDEEVCEVTLNNIGKDPAEPSEDPAEQLSEEELAKFKSELNLQCPEEKREEYEKLCIHFHDVFSRSKFDLGRCGVIKHKVHMKDEIPRHQKQFPIPLAHRETIYNWVDELLASGAIELSRSLYNSPIFLIRKPHGGGMRAVLDFRAINNASLPDRYNIREVRECLDEVGQNQSDTFSCLDLVSGFWQQILEEKSRQYTAFTVPGRQTRFQWTVSPMGLQGSPASFSRLMDYCMRGLTNVLTYIDDILCHTRGHERHLEVLRNVFLRLRKYGLKLNSKKSAIASSECEYLGFHLSGKGVSPGTEKLQAMRSFPEPDSIKKVREFIGCCNYFRSLIPRFSHYSGCLTALLKKESKWKKGPLPIAAANAFRFLKGALCSNPVVCHPQPEGIWHLTTDASQGDAEHPGGLGAVLTQIVDKQEHVIAYASRGLKKHECNYSAFLLEMQAACWGIETFNVYLVGRRFTLFTDHRPLESMGTIHKRTLNRLQQTLLEHDFEVKYKKGDENVVADALSRNAVMPVKEDTAGFEKSPVEVLSDESGTLVQAQADDELCSDLINYMKTGVLPEDKQQKYVNNLISMSKNSFVGEDGVLYFVHVRANQRTRNAVVLPESLRSMVLLAAHNTLVSGHGGVDRTKERLFMSYYWPGIHEQTKRYVADCQVCQMAKGRKPPPMPLNSLAMCDRPNERVHLDCFGPLKTSEGGNKMVLIITDAFTKWTEIVAMEDKSAASVSKAFFEKWIVKFSVPLVIVTDRGREFNNEMMNKLCDYLGIDHNLTSPYHPQSNSSAESFNRSMKKYLRTGLENSGTLDWEALLPVLQLSYNCHVHKTTLESPFFLTYGADPRLPFFSLGNPQPIYKSDHVTDTFQNFTAAHKMVHQNQWQAKTIRENYFNLKTKERSFDIGDRVMFHNPAVPRNANAKFFKTWSGPFYVVKKISPLNYVIQRSPRSKQISCHVEKLKLLLGPDLNACFDSSKNAPPTSFTNLLHDKIDPASLAYSAFARHNNIEEHLEDHEVRHAHSVMREAAESAPQEEPVIRSAAPVTRSKSKAAGLFLQPGLQKSRI